MTPFCALWWKMELLRLLVLQLWSISVSIITMMFTNKFTSDKKECKNQNYKRLGEFVEETLLGGQKGK
jgi:hypothetical protein